MAFKTGRRTFTVRAVIDVRSKALPSNKYKFQLKIFNDARKSSVFTISCRNYYDSTINLVEVLVISVLYTDDVP